MTSHCHYCGVRTDRIKQLEAELQNLRGYAEKIEEQLARAMDMLVDVEGGTAVRKIIESALLGTRCL